MNYNYKKLLCARFLNDKYCKYGDKCIYAHSREEQAIDSIRRHVLNCMICKTYDKIDLKNERQYLELLRYATVCDKCENNTCIGGYNCANGTVDKKFMICKDNLINICNNNCGKIHIREQSKDIKKIRSYRYINTGDNNSTPVIVEDDDEINDDDVEIIHILEQELKNEEDIK
jgi:hypothetical protein